MEMHETVIRPNEIFLKTPRFTFRIFVARIQMTMIAADARRQGRTIIAHASRNASVGLLIIQLILVEVYIYVITALIFRIVHFLHSPVSSLPCNSKVICSLSFYWLTSVDVVNAGGDLSCKSKMKRIYDRQSSIYLKII